MKHMQRNNERAIKKKSPSFLNDASIVSFVIIIFSLFSVLIVIGVDIILNKNLEDMDRILTNPTDIIGKFDNIFLSIIVMVICEIKQPGGDLIRGLFRLDTTRGDRLFITLLGSGFIHLAWLGLLDISIWGAMVFSIGYAIAVFKWV